MTENLRSSDVAYFELIYGRNRDDFPARCNILYYLVRYCEIYNEAGKEVEPKRQAQLFPKLEKLTFYKTQ